MSSALSIRRIGTFVLTISPGLSLAACLAFLALLLRTNVALFSNLTPLILALGLGLALRNTVGVPISCKPGVVFGLRRVLRFAVMLLGLQLSLQQLVDVGFLGIAIVVASLACTYLVTVWLGRRLGVD